LVGDEPQLTVTLLFQTLHDKFEGKHVIMTKIPEFDTPLELNSIGTNFRTPLVIVGLKTLVFYKALKISFSIHPQLFSIVGFVHGQTCKVFL
jgi:hypothetical protein